MAKKVLIIFNPKAGFRYPKFYRERFLKYFKKYLPGIDYDWLATKPDLTGQLKQLDFKLYGKVIAVGGDGTIKEIADYFLTNRLDLPLAIVPQGSANILASSLNLPLGTKPAIKTACLGREKRIDVGLVNGRHYFLICLSVGHLSKVINKTERGLKIKLGFGAYLKTLIKLKKINQTEFKFNLDGRPYRLMGNTLIIANALSILKLKPASPVDYVDGRFDLFIAKNKTFFGFFIVAFGFFFNKRWLPAIFKASGKKISVALPASKIKAVQLDGEYLKLDKIQVEMIPKRLKIVS
ncbi:MAG TPA: diacylglycerol kinase family protein [Patescibacteria group bacterium]|nr:diacylglycerol kinase family protein [Patescibacteria group bacterium]